MKTHAYVLVSTDPKGTNDTFGRLCDIQGVKSAYQTAGRYDSVLWVEAENYNDIPKIVCDKIRSIEGVRHTETLFAFERR